MQSGLSPSSQPTLLPSAVLSLLSGTLNHLLNGEAWARESLIPHAGKLVKLALPPLAVSFAIMPDGRLGVGPEGEVGVDVELSLPLSAVPQLAGAALLGQGESAALKHVRISGDADLAQAVGRLAQHLRWDAEEDLSRWVGDAAAYRIANAGRAAANTARLAGTRLSANLVEYLTEEQATLVLRHQAIAFGEQVRQLREDLERLDKRIRKLPHSA